MTGDRLTPAQRSMIGQIAALTRWAHEPDRRTATQPMRDGMLAKFEREVDPDGVMDPGERRRRAELLRAAYMRRLALASSRARAAKKQSGDRQAGGR